MANIRWIPQIISVPIRMLWLLLSGGKLPSASFSFANTNSQTSHPWVIHCLAFLCAPVTTQGDSYASLFIFQSNETYPLLIPNCVSYRSRPVKHIGAQGLTYLKSCNNHDLCKALGPEWSNFMIYLNTCFQLIIFYVYFLILYFSLQIKYGFYTNSVVQLASEV